MSFDTTNKATLLAQLKAAYYNLIAGEQTITVEYQDGNGARQLLTYHKAEAKLLAIEIGKLEIEVAKEAGKPRRFGMASGGTFR